MEDKKVVDRELDDEKDVVWGTGHKKQTKGTLKYNALLTEAALRYAAAGKLEKRPIVEELVAGLSFVHLKDGRVCKELGKKQVVRKTMDKLNKEAKSQARLPKEPPAPSNAEATIVHSAPSNTRANWNETIMQAFANQQKHDNLNVIGNQSVSNTTNNVTNNYINDNSSELGKITHRLGNIEGKVDLNHDELRSVNKKVTGLTPAKPRNQGCRWGTPSPPRQPSFDSPPAAELSHLDGLSYCKELLSTQENTGLQNLVKNEMQELKEIRILKTTFESLPTMATAHLNLQQAVPNLLCIIQKDKIPMGCIFYEVNDFVDKFEDHNNEIMIELAKSLGLSHKMILRAEGEEEEEREAEVTMAVNRNSHTNLSSIMTFVCEIVIECSPCINLVGFLGPSSVTKHDLSLNADVLEKLLRHFSHLQFEDLRLVDTHLEVMGKATGGVKVFKFDRCEFSVEGTNFLFLREPESPMKLQVLEIPDSSFFTDCKEAIKSGVLASLLITTSTDPTRLRPSDFWMVVDIQRELADKGKELFFSRNTEVDRPFNVGMVDVELPNCTLSSKLAPVAIKKVAKMNPCDYKNEEQYKTAAIKIAMSVLQ